MRTFLDFEKPIAELEGKIEDLRHLSSSSDINIADEVARLQKKLETLLSQTYRKLSPWQKTQVARHVDRPHALTFIRDMFTDFVPLGGDRRFGEDLAMVGGLARFRDAPVVVIGQEKGHDTDTRIRHNFGMPRPEGYRKAERLMRLGDRFRLPVITLIDTPGAYPGVDAEARGQAEAIARCIETCLTLSVPLISVIIGEGGSGGAIALAAGDRVLMLEHAIYSVISPEGCASILWRDSDQAPAAAQALRLTAGDLQGLAIIDEIIGEPLGGAQRDPTLAIANTADAIARALDALRDDRGQDRRDQRRRRFLAIGAAA